MEITVKSLENFDKQLRSIWKTLELPDHLKDSLRRLSRIDSEFYINRLELKDHILKFLL
jgi:SpoVK/Ycf46/Vps4 family AAA+-type ATPase